VRLCVCRVRYVGPKSRTERPRKTKIGTEVAHVTRDSDTTFKVKGKLAGGAGILWRPPAQLVILCVECAAADGVQCCDVIVWAAGRASDL